MKKLNDIARHKLNRYPASKVFNLAADILEKSTWQQGYLIAYKHGKRTVRSDSFREDAIKFSADGALLEAQRLMGAKKLLVYPYERFFIKALNLGGLSSIAEWQDRKSRTKKEVVKALRAAATVARYEER